MRSGSGHVAATVPAIELAVACKEDEQGIVWLEILGLQPSAEYFFDRAPRSLLVEECVDAVVLVPELVPEYVADLPCIINSIIECI
jgi:hypothetical protein